MVAIIGEVYQDIQTSVWMNFDLDVFTAKCPVEQHVAVNRWGQHWKQAFVATQVSDQLECYFHRCTAYFYSQRAVPACLKCAQLSGPAVRSIETGTDEFGDGRKVAVNHFRHDG